MTPHLYILHHATPRNKDNDSHNATMTPKITDNSYLVSKPYSNIPICHKNAL